MLLSLYSCHVPSSCAQVWNPITGACLSTMDSGYGLCCLFAPGGRHVVLGTKVGVPVGEVWRYGANHLIKWAINQ